MNKNDHDLQVRVHSAVYILIKEKGFASPVDVLIFIGVLSKEDFERWRFGKVDYLECICKVNLRKLSFINHEIRSYAQKHDLKPSWDGLPAMGQGQKRPAPVFKKRRCNYRKAVRHALCQPAEN